MTYYVKVKFVNQYATSTNYSFKADIPYLKEGDYVVCDTKAGLAVGKVESITDTADSKATAWIVCKIDVESHTKRLEKEKRIAELKNKVNKRVKELQESILIEHLANQDVQLKVMLTELKSLERM